MLFNICLLRESPCSLLWQWWVLFMANSWVHRDKRNLDLPLFLLDRDRSNSSEQLLLTSNGRWILARLFLTGIQSFVIRLFECWAWNLQACCLFSQTLIDVRLGDRPFISLSADLSLSVIPSMVNWENCSLFHFTLDPFYHSNFSQSNNLLLLQKLHTYHSL